MSAHDIVAVGASAGGGEALRKLVSALPADLLLPQILSRAGLRPWQMSKA